MQLQSALMVENVAGTKCRKCRDLNCMTNALKVTVIKRRGKPRF